MYDSVINKLLRSSNLYPEKISVISGERQCNYNMLAQEMLSCASYLVNKGVKRGDRVALLMDNSVEYISSYYGAIMIGAIIVPLNSSAKASDIVNWIKHCGATVFIVGNKHYDTVCEQINSLSNLLTIVVPVDQGNNEYYWSVIEKPLIDVDSYISSIHPQMPVAIMYTSGTTGQPKGVVLTHSNFVENFTEVVNYLNISTNDSILNVLPFYYSYGNSILHTHLMTGATIVLENSFMYPAKILKLIEQYKITGFSGVPATYAILLSRTNLSEYNLSSLRYVTQAGGAMPPSNIKRFIEQVKNIQFFVMYGQTEATARLTYLDPNMLFEKMGSVGKPLRGISIEIRNEDSVAVGENTEGELYVNGPNIMKGYWNNDKQTSEVLNDNYLKTGDIGYKDQDGYIFLTGRRSDMIKVGGNRISPLEIEEIVNQLDGIEEVAATGSADELLGQVVKLTIVKKPGSDINENKIKSYCKQNLALYKIPKYIEFVESLPKTASGKVKRYML